MPPTLQDQIDRKHQSCDQRIQARDPELAAKVFRGLIEGSINYPALYEPQKTAAELKPLKEEIIALFLSRYG